MTDLDLEALDDELHRSRHSEVLMADLSRRYMQKLIDELKAYREQIAVLQRDAISAQLRAEGENFLEGQESVTGSDRRIAMNYEKGQEIIVRAWWRNQEPTRCRIESANSYGLLVKPLEGNPHARYVDFENVFPIEGEGPGATP